MRNIRIAIWGLLFGPALLWVGSNLTLPSTQTSLDRFKLLLQFSGVLTIGVKSTAMILTTRSRWLVQRLNGLDQAYRLHKWLGISVLILALTQ